MPQKAKNHGNKAADRIRKDKKRHPWYDHRWTKARNVFIKQNPLCTHCEKNGRVAAAEVVDHIIPWKTGKTEEERFSLFWDQGNWQGLCKACNAEKSIREDGWMGR